VVDAAACLIRVNDAVYFAGVESVLLLVAKALQALVTVSV